MATRKAAKKSHRTSPKSRRTKPRSEEIRPSPAKPQSENPDYGLGRFLRGEDANKESPGPFEDEEREPIPGALRGTETRDTGRTNTSR